MRTNPFWAALITCIAVTAFGATLRQSPPAKTNEQLTGQQWQDDLRTYAEQLPKRHKNAFHFTTRSQFEAAVKEFGGQLRTANYDQAAVGFARLQSMIGDAHTNLGLPNDVMRLFPLRVNRFGDDYRVVGVLPGNDKCLGARIVKIDQTPVSDAIDKLASLVQKDEYPWFAAAVAQSNIVFANFLHGLGITASRETARYTFMDDRGKEFTAELKSNALDEDRAAKWVRVQRRNPVAAIAEPVHKLSDHFAYWFIPSKQVVYCACYEMRNLAGPGAELMNFVKEKKPSKLIIDLRGNAGGSYFEGLNNLIAPISKMPDINSTGHLFVLINALTGSAAMADASLFHTKTKAVLVGEPIGVKPTEYSEYESFSLPNSGFKIGYAVMFYKFAYNEENVIRPEHEVSTPWDVYKAGHDSAIDWVLSQQP